MEAMPRKELTAEKARVLRVLVGKACSSWRLTAGSLYVGTSNLEYALKMCAV